MAYKVQFTLKASKQLAKMDNEIKTRITKQLKKVEALENPRDQGKALQGGFSDSWAYRVGRYRLITKIQDNNLLVLLIKISHRSTVYKK